MNKKHILFSLLLAAGVLSACGGEKKTEENKDEKTEDVKEEPKDEFGDKCTAGNKITLNISKYKYGMSGDYKFDGPDFEVKQSSFTKLTDSTADLKFSNYLPEELKAERADNQVDIMVKLTARKKNVLAPGVYAYSDWEKPMYSGVTIQTAKGTVYFNWVMGMPEQGHVKVDFVDDTRICGSFALNVEKPESEMIGVVRLNGTFSIGEPK